MGFNELNSVEYYIIHQLTGVNLNNNTVAEPKVGYGAQWQFVAPNDLQRIVNDIDAIVRVVNFPGWQNTTSGEREVQKSLRKALLKYKLHKDQILFDRAYSYIKEYY